MRTALLVTALTLLALAVIAIPVVVVAARRGKLRLPGRRLETYRGPKASLVSREKFNGIDRASALDKRIFALSPALEHEGKTHEYVVASTRQIPGGGAFTLVYASDGLGIESFQELVGVEGDYQAALWALGYRERKQ